MKNLAFGDQLMLLVLNRTERGLKLRNLLLTTGAMCLLDVFRQVEEFRLLLLLLSDVCLFLMYAIAALLSNESVGRMEWVLIGGLLWLSGISW